MIPFNPFSILASKVYAGVAIAGLTFAAVQTVRIEGLRIWPLRIEGYAAANERLRADLARVIVAQAEAERFAIEARAATEKLSKGLADAADAQARHLDADSRRNLADRVRQAPRCSASGSASPGVPDNPARDPGADPAGVYLTLDEADALRRHEVRSVTCEGWALDLMAQGLAVE